MQAGPITTNVVTSNLARVRGTHYVHYVIKFVRSVVFSGYSSNKTDHHDIAEKLLKVVFNTITIKPTQNELTTGLSKVNKRKQLKPRFMLIVVVCLMAFNATFNNISVIVAVSLIREVSRTTLRKATTCCKSLTNFIT